MKRQKSAAFVKKLEHEYTNDKSHLKFKNYCYQTGTHRDPTHSVYNLK